MFEFKSFELLTISYRDINRFQCSVTKIDYMYNALAIPTAYRNSVSFEFRLHIFDLLEVRTSYESLCADNWYNTRRMLLVLIQVLIQLDLINKYR